MNVELVSRVPYRDIERRFGVGRNALKRHAQEHIPKLLVESSRAVDIGNADELLARVESLQGRTLAILEAAEGTGELRTALGAIREARGNLELLGRLAGELEAGTTVNLYLSPEWIELRAVIVGALEPYQDAREDVLKALEGASGATRP
jgi:hypothetical protein